MISLRSIVLAIITLLIACVGRAQTPLTFPANTFANRSPLLTDLSAPHAPFANIDWTDTEKITLSDFSQFMLYDYYHHLKISEGRLQDQSLLFAERFESFYYTQAIFGQPN